MEKVREALTVWPMSDEAREAAWAEVEEWEADREQDERIIVRCQADRDDADLSAQLSRDATEIWKARAEAAEAERDRLAGLLVEHHALGVMDGLGAGDDCPICARAALAADEAKT
jgi:hypothetical protein